MKALGPNFGNEVIAAGLAIVPFSWGADGATHFAPETTDDQRDAIAALIAAHDPQKDDPNKTYARKVAAGLTVTATATPALDAVYAVDNGAVQVISGIAAGIATRDRLPGGGAAFEYADITGHPHSFNSADFLNFAAAVEDYAYALVQTQRTLSAGGSAEWPSSDVVIA